MKYVKVKVVCYDLNGKKNNKTFLVDAESFAEAEEKVYKTVSADKTALEVNVRSMGIVQFSECKLTQNGDDFFKVTLCIMSVDENTGRQKKTKYTMLVECYDAKDVNLVVEQVMSMEVYDILKIEKLNVEDVIS